MRRCKGTTNIYRDGKRSIEEFEGTFHQWGVSYEEFESGACNFSTAIVELDDGKVIMPMADQITFLDKLN